jgi:ribosomal protein S27AE
MAETIYTQTLAKAAEFHGSTQSLANFLHVPEATLLRWMSGRAQMPLQAFLKLIQAIAQRERASGGPDTPDDSGGKPRTFKIGELLARCARCGSTEFVAAGSESPTRLTARLACRACGEQVIHGDLISRLAKEAVQQSRAPTP